MDMAEDQKALVYEGKGTSISVMLPKDMMNELWFTQSRENYTQYLRCLLRGYTARIVYLPPSLQRATKS